MDGDPEGEDLVDDDIAKLSVYVHEYMGWKTSFVQDDVSNKDEQRREHLIHLAQVMPAQADRIPEGTRFRTIADAKSAAQKTADKRKQHQLESRRFEGILPKKKGVKKKPAKTGR